VLERITLVKCHLSDQGMEFGYAGTGGACLIVSIMETRIEGGSLLLAPFPVMVKIIATNLGGHHRGAMWEAESGNQLLGVKIHIWEALINALENSR